MKDERINDAREGFSGDMRAYREGGLFEDTPVGRGGMPELRQGDVLLRLLAQPSSLCIASAMLSGYSHCAVVVEVGGGLHVADCYPGDGNEGGTRGVPAGTWLEGARDGGSFHWLALRHPDLDAAMLPAAVASLSGEFAFRHIADAMSTECDAKARLIGNCSTFLMAIFERTGPELGGVRALGDVNRLGFVTFVELLKNGFYDVFKAQGALSFYELAREHGVVDMICWKGSVLPPAFPEFTPGFAVVGYLRSEHLAGGRFNPWLDHYRRRVPALRAAVRCHGLSPDQVPAEIAKAAGPVFERALASQPADRPLDAITCNRRILMNEVRDPATYVTLPMSAGLAANGIGPVRLLAARAALASAPALLSLAGALGWRALAPFSKPHA